MKKISLYTLFAVSFLFTFNVNSLYAQTTTQVVSSKVSVSAGITPDSYFYFLDMWVEKLSSLLNFTSEQKIKFEMDLAKERLAEYKEIKNKPDVDQSIVLEIKGQIKEHVAEALKQEKDAKDHGEEIQSVKKDVQEDINDIDEDINNFDEGEDNTSQVHENNDDDKESKSIHASSTLKESNKGQHFIFEGEDNERNNH